MLRASDGIRVKLQKEEKEYHAMSNHNKRTRDHNLLTDCHQTGTNKEMTN